MIVELLLRKLENKLFFDKDRTHDSRTNWNPIKGHEEVLSLQPMIPPERFDIFSPVWGMLTRSRYVSSYFSFKVWWICEVTS